MKVKKIKATNRRSKIIKKIKKRRTIRRITRQISRNTKEKNFTWDRKKIFLI